MSQTVRFHTQTMPWSLVLALTVLLQLLNGAKAQTCQSTLPLNLTRLLPVPTDYKFTGEGVTNYSPLNLESGTCHVWTLQQNQLHSLSCGQSPDNQKSYIVIEIRRNAGNDTGPSFPLEVAVNAAFQSEGKYYLSKPFRDAAAIDYARPYHQIVVPATLAMNYTPYQWWITVANPNSGGSFFVSDYSVSATCLSDPPHTPCPKPIDGSEDCSGHGRCIPADGPAEGVELAGVQCLCDSGWGDYACQKQIASITAPTWNSIALPPGYWQYYHVQLPKEYQASELLVELEAVAPKSKPVPWRFLLCVKPYGPFGVPWMPDLSAYCDVTSYLLSQVHHFKVLARSMLAAQDYYIAVYHRDYIHDSMLDKAINAPPALKNPPAVISTAQLRLRVLVSQLSWPAPSPSFVCPWDCNNAGTCIEGSQSNQWNRYLGAMLPFTCTCDAGFTGPLCAFATQDLVVSVDRDSANTTMTLQAGAWAQFTIRVASPAQFFTRPGLAFTIQAALQGQSMSRGAGNSSKVNPRPKPLWLRIDPPSWNPYASPFTALSQGAQVYDRVIGMNATVPLTIPYREYWWPLFYNGSLPLPGGLFVPSDGILAKVSVFHNPYIDQTEMDFMIHLDAKSKAVPKVPVTKQPLANISRSPAPGTKAQPSSPSATKPEPPAIDRNSSLALNSNRTIILPGPNEERRNRADSARTVGFIIGVSVGCAAAALATAGWIIGHARSRRMRNQQELESQAFQRSTPPLQTPSGDDHVTPTVRVFMGGLPGLIVDTFPTYQYMPGRKEEDVTPGRAPSPNPMARLLRSGRNGFRRDRQTPGRTGSISDVESCAGTPKDGKSSSIAPSESEGSMRTMCTVCLDPFQPGDIVRILPCSHQFHQVCIDQWLARQASCPTCRAGFMPPNVAEMMRSIRLAQAYEQQTRLRRSMTAPPPPSPTGQPRRGPSGWLGVLRLGRLVSALGMGGESSLGQQAQLQTGVMESVPGLDTGDSVELQELATGERQPQRPPREPQGEIV